MLTNFNYTFIINKMMYGLVETITPTALLRRLILNILYVVFQFVIAH